MRAHVYPSRALAQRAIAAIDEALGSTERLRVVDVVNGALVERSARTVPRRAWCEPIPLTRGPRAGGFAVVFNQRKLAAHAGRGEVPTNATAVDISDADLPAAAARSRKS